ncbi:MAG: ADP-heptose synthase, bifunctional sugar kinase/adenylyltransferase [Verrucomicrobia bacterium]|jgi:bifunctional ADP-heptose synthase (sugar kinase/adenylyltransferase)|nr:ADP-heptose synthase, bifunctional sugar kinase/adenylyltransferase [Verrucomicrobiota bacterium]
MTPKRYQQISSQFPKMRIAIIGDFCLDRYLEIDLAKEEISIETGLPVHNVMNVRSQPGGSGTILNNLVALGVGEIVPVGFAGDDGEGFELVRALKQTKGVDLCSFFQTADRRTFTYTKPIVVGEGKPPKASGKEAGRSPMTARTPVKSTRGPRELNRLDFKNWSATPAAVSKRLITNITEIASKMDALILLDQVDIAGTGVLTKEVLSAIGKIAKKNPHLVILADSRNGLSQFPAVDFKMNGTELSRALGSHIVPDLAELHRRSSQLAVQTGHRIFVTLSECGIIGAAPDGTVEHVPSLPVRGEIDIVGAGDSVTANLVTSLLGQATLRESLEIANTAASIVIHQLGTTGTASRLQIKSLLA